MTENAARSANFRANDPLVPHPPADDIGAQFRAATQRLMIRRLRIGLLILLSSVPVFALLDLRFEKQVLVPLCALKLGTMVFSAAVYGLLNRPRVAAQAAVLAWLSVALICVGAALSGIIAGESFAPAVLCLSVTLVSAMALPWSAGAQMSAAVVAAAAVGTNFHGLHGHAPTSDTIMGVAAVLVMLAMSVALNYELRQHRFRSKREALERQRAERQVSALNESLERRVQERTAQLEAARQRLEVEMAERQHASEALRASQGQLQDIIDKSTTVIYLKDIHGRYRLVNSRWEEVFHLPRAATVGKTDFELFPHDAAVAFRANDRQVLEGNQPLQFDEVAPHDDGPHSYISVKFPLHDAAGIPSGICGISTDISPRKQMEAELRRSQSTLAALIESSGDAIWSIDPAYRLVTVNSVAKRQFHQRFGIELTIGMSFDEAVPLEIRTFWHRLYDRALAGERVTVHQAVIGNDVNGHYLITLNPITDAGATTGVTIFAKDITDLKQAEQQTRQHQAELAHVLRLRTMGEMVASLAHEINQPLGAITNYAGGCQRRIGAGTIDAADFGEAVDHIAEEALRAGEILRRLRGLIRKESPEYEAVDVNHVVGEAVRVMRSEAHLRGTTIRLVTAPEMPTVNGDGIQIEQVLMNLLLNAVEAMESLPSGQRELTVQTALVDGATVEVSVRDTGVGVTPAASKRLFDAFFTTKPAGLGMGLAISRSIIEAHNGRLWVTPNPERGSTFHFTIPLA